MSIATALTEMEAPTRIAVEIDSQFSAGFLVTTAYLMEDLVLRLAFGPGEQEQWAHLLGLPVVCPQEEIDITHDWSLEDWQLTFGVGDLLRILARRSHNGTDETKADSNQVIDGARADSNKRYAQAFVGAIEAMATLGKITAEVYDAPLMIDHAGPKPFSGKAKLRKMSACWMALTRCLEERPLRPLEPRTPKAWIPDFCIGPTSEAR